MLLSNVSSTFRGIKRLTLSSQSGQPYFISPVLCVRSFLLLFSSSLLHSQHKAIFVARVYFFRVRYPHCTLNSYSAFLLQLIICRCLIPCLVLVRFRCRATFSDVQVRICSGPFLLVKSAAEDEQN